MNSIIDLRTSGLDAASVQHTRRSMSRLAYLHGLIKPGVCDYIRARVKGLLVDRGIVPADPEMELRAQRLDKMDPQEAAYMLSGVAARCDYIISLPTFVPEGIPIDAPETPGLTELTTRELRQLGMTTFLWPDYGPGGPSMNPLYRDNREYDALNVIANWSPEAIGFAGVLTAGPHRGPYAEVNHAAACPMPMQDGVGATRHGSNEAERIDRVRRHRENKVGFGEARQVG